MNLPTSRRSFRILLLIHVFTSVTYVTVLAVQPAFLYSDAIVQYFESAPTSQSETYWMVVATMSMIVSLAQLVAVAGLYFFRNWARWLYFILTLVGILAYPVYEIQVIPGGVEMIGAITNLFASMVIVLLLIKPVSVYFTSPDASNRKEAVRGPAA